MRAAAANVRATAIVAGITAATAVVAVAARAPSARSTPTDAASASAPVTALFILLLGAGIVLLATVLVLAFRQRRREDDHRLSEPPEVPWIWKVVACLVPFALGVALIVAAVAGSKKVPIAPGLSGGFGGASGRAALGVGTRNGFVLPAWLPWTILALVVVAIAAGAVLFALRRNGEPAAAPEQGGADEAVEAAIAALETDTDPRGAVIAAYAAMQRTLAAHGLRRSTSEAPREFLARVLVADRAPERDAGTLTWLFEEARFSTHPISERTRERALAALRSLERRPKARGGR